jgi:hypothetical protein
MICLLAASLAHIVLARASPLLLEYDGDLQTVTPRKKLAYLPAHCKHFDSRDEPGDPFWTPDALAAVR